MKRGPKPTTLRGRAAGGKEIRAWVSSAEMDRIKAAAEAKGLDVSAYVRMRALEVVE